MAEKTLRAGVIGLGAIGGGVAVSLINSGREPVVYDVLPDAYKKHPGLRKQLASPAEVAGLSDVIMLAVLTAAQARDALAGENGILSGAHEGMVVVLLATISVREAKELAELCAQRQVGFLDCGVTPGNLAASNGLIALVGGDEATLERARPVLEDWSASIVHCGGTGTGMVAKIARNVNNYSYWRITYETSRMVMAAGIDLKTYVEMLETIDNAERLYLNFLRHCAKTPDGKLPAEMTDMYSKFLPKDLKASIELSESLGIAMPVRDAVYEMLDETLNLK